MLEGVVDDGNCVCGVGLYWLGMVVCGDGLLDVDVGLVCVDCCVDFCGCLCCVVGLGVDCCVVLVICGCMCRWGWVGVLVVVCEYWGVGVVIGDVDGFYGLDLWCGGGVLVVVMIFGW